MNITTNADEVQKRKLSCDNDDSSNMKMQQRRSSSADSDSKVNQILQEIFKTTKETNNSSAKEDAGFEPGSTVRVSQRSHITPKDRVIMTQVNSSLDGNERRNPAIRLTDDACESQGSSLGEQTQRT